MPSRLTRTTTTLLLTLLLTTPLARAADAPPPAPPAAATDIVLAGLKAYQEKGATEAIAAWIKGSAMDGSKEALSQAGQFERIETFYGKLTGWEVLREEPIAATSTLIFVSMNYEKGPIFARFHLYRGSTGWMIANFDFNTKPEAVMPSVLLEK
jgi:hypothetical protein